MGEWWMQLLAALIGGVVGAAMTLSASSRRRRTIAQPLADLPLRTASQRFASTPPGLDRWLRELQRCEQAVHRAAQAVEAVSSSTARLDLRSVIRRMEAELPNVLVLVELGRGLDVVGRDESGRVLRQLADAAARFATVADQVLETVVDLVATPDLDQVHRQVVALREQFPLQRPLSALLANHEWAAEPLVGATG